MEILYKYFRPKDGNRETRMVNLITSFFVNVGWVMCMIGLLIMLDKLSSTLELTQEGVLVNKLKEMTIIFVPFTENVSYLYMDSMTAIDFFFACVLAPLWEEFMFRYLPFALFIAPKLIEKAGLNEDQEKERAQFVRRYLGLLILSTSIIFGILHGGPVNILFQGVGGIILWKIFLQSGKYRYWYAVGAHALWNISVSIGLFVITG